eukprot:9280275-Lingulodinium_polyedra.AAC.1
MAAFWWFGVAVVVVVGIATNARLCPARKQRPWAFGRRRTGPRTRRDAARTKCRRRNTGARRHNANGPWSIPPQ